MSEKFYVGQGYEIPIPFAWLTWREKIRRIFGLAPKQPKTPAVIVAIDYESGAITVDAAPYREAAS